MEIYPLLTAVENDPYDLDTHDLKKAREILQFQTSQNTGTNMELVLYMVEDLNFFETQSQAKIKSIALEIAYMGTQGFNPQKEGYKLSNIPSKTFSGYQILHTTTTAGHTTCLNNYLNYNYPLIKNMKWH